MRFPGFRADAGRSFPDDLHRLENRELVSSVLRELRVAKPLRKDHRVPGRIQHIQQKRRVATPHR